jgi:hypothetical protein
MGRSLHPHFPVPEIAIWTGKIRVKDGPLAKADRWNMRKLDATMHARRPDGPATSVPTHRCADQVINLW